ncbi:MAG: hypothetical protein V3U49_02480 [Nitrososphaerales archaeon]
MQNSKRISTQLGDKTLSCKIDDTLGEKFVVLTKRRGSNPNQAIKFFIVKYVQEGEEDDGMRSNSGDEPIGRLSNIERRIEESTHSHEQSFGGKDDGGTPTFEQVIGSELVQKLRVLSDQITRLKEERDRLTNSSTPETIIQSDEDQLNNPEINNLVVTCTHCDATFPINKFFKHKINMILASEDARLARLERLFEHTESTQELHHIDPECKDCKDFVQVLKL